MKAILLVFVLVACLAFASATNRGVLNNPAAMSNAVKIWGECGACKIAAESLISVGCGAGSGACGPFEPACELICEVCIVKIVLCNIGSHLLLFEIGCVRRQGLRWLGLLQGNPFDCPFRCYSYCYITDSCLWLWLLKRNRRCFDLIRGLSRSNMILIVI